MFAWVDFVQGYQYFYVEWLDSTYKPIPTSSWTWSFTFCSMKCGKDLILSYATLWWSPTSLPTSLPMPSDFKFVWWGNYAYYSPCSLWPGAMQGPRLKRSSCVMSGTYDRLTVISGWRYGCCQRIFWFDAW